MAKTRPRGLTCGKGGCVSNHRVGPARCLAQTDFTRVSSFSFWVKERLWETLKSGVVYICHFNTCARNDRTHRRGFLRPSLLDPCSFCLPDALPPRSSLPTARTAGSTVHRGPHLHTSPAEIHFLTSSVCKSVSRVTRLPCSRPPAASLLTPVQAPRCGLRCSGTGILRTC